MPSFFLSMRRWKPRDPAWANHPQTNGVFVMRPFLAHTPTLRALCPESPMPMKLTAHIFWVMLVCTVPVQAQDRIYRCGNEYTNTITEAQAKECKVVSGGNVTVVQAPKNTGAVRLASSSANAPRVDAGDQRGRDSDSRLILESELKKAESRQADLLKEFNNGEPEKLGPETRNHQKYLDRVAELRAAISRNESDIAGIRRELGRVGGQASAGGTGAK